ncbi:Uncharacterised protein g3571 [Pycnogonum litorale]
MDESTGGVQLFHVDGIKSSANVEKCVQHLLDKEILIDDGKCFDQLANLKLFIEKHIDEEEFKNMLAHQKWTRYFHQSKNITCHSELLKIASFFFAIPAHNANVERVFSLMQSQWTKDRNKLTVDSVKGLLLLQYNFTCSCKEFFSMLKNHESLLKQMRSSVKYS